jgi:hypothetical protein
MSKRSAFEALVAEIAATTGLRVSTAELGAPASKAQLATAEGYCTAGLPPGVEQFFGEMNGFHLEWKGADGDAGAIHLLPVERIFGNWRETIWFPGDERFRDLYPFDFFQPETCIAFRVHEDEEPARQVYLHALGEASCSLGRSFNEYTALLLESRGYLHWQHCLSADTNNNPEAARFRERAPALFPDLKLERFKP